MARKYQGVFAKKIDEIFVRRGWKPLELRPVVSSSLIQKIRRQNYLPEPQTIGLITEALKQRGVEITFEELVKLSKRQERSVALAKRKASTSRRASPNEIDEGAPTEECRPSESLDWIVEHPFYEGICQQLDSIFEASSLKFASKLIVVIGANTTIINAVAAGMAGIWAKKDVGYVLIADLYVAKETQPDAANVYWDEINAFCGFGMGDNKPDISKPHSLRLGLLPTRNIGVLISKFRSGNFDRVILPFPPTVEINLVLQVAGYSDFVLSFVEPDRLTPNSFQGPHPLSAAKFRMKRVGVRNLSHV